MICSLFFVQKLSTSCLAFPYLKTTCHCASAAHRRSVFYRERAAGALIDFVSLSLHDSFVMESAAICVSRISCVCMQCPTGS